MSGTIESIPLTPEQRCGLTVGCTGSCGSERCPARRRSQFIGDGCGPLLERADAYECATQRCDPNQCRHAGSAVDLPVARVQGRAYIGPVDSTYLKLERSARLLGTWLACHAEQLLAVMVLTTAALLVAIAWTWWI